MASGATGQGQEQNGGLTVEEVPHFDGLGAAARKKLGAPEGWEWYSAKVLAGDDVLLEGGVPHKDRAPKYRWKGIAGVQVVVTSADLAAARSDYERTTGNCWECAGSGKTLKSVSVASGVTYRECARCKGSGSPL